MRQFSEKDRESLYLLDMFYEIVKKIESFCQGKENYDLDYKGKSEKIEKSDHP